MSGSVIDSFRLEIAIASPRFASLLKSECVWFTQKDLHSIRRTVTLKTLSFQILRYRAPGLGVKIPGYLNTWTPEYLEPGLGFCHVDRLFLEAGRLFPIHHNRGAHWQLDSYRRFLCCKIVAIPGFAQSWRSSLFHLLSPFRIRNGESCKLRCSTIQHYCKSLTTKKGESAAPKIKTFNSHNEDNILSGGLPNFHIIILHMVGQPHQVSLCWQVWTTQTTHTLKNYFDRLDTLPL